MSQLGHKPKRPLLGRGEATGSELQVALMGATPAAAPKRKKVTGEDWSCILS